MSGTGHPALFGRPGNFVGGVPFILLIGARNNYPTIEIVLKDILGKALGNILACNDIAVRILAHVGRQVLDAFVMSRKTALGWTPPIRARSCGSLQMRQ